MILIRFRPVIFLMWMLVLVLSGCKGLQITSEENQITKSAISTVAPTETKTPIPPTKSATLTPSTTIEPTITMMVPEPTAPCPGEVCEIEGHFVLSRPISDTNNSYSDRVYLYGTTLGGTLKPHLGVEFQNEVGVPVLAAEAGIVIIARDDSFISFGIRPGFYGNLVILKHDLQDYEEPVYTLYAHLSEILVEEGDTVSAGEIVGKVGATGSVGGSHLHFEVRYSDMGYKNTRNPELWLLPHSNEDGSANGAIIGRVIDGFGDLMEVNSVTLVNVDAEEDIEQEPGYFEGYKLASVNSDDIWMETFTIPDLQPGKYEIHFIAYGLQKYIVDVFPGKITLIEFDKRSK